MTEAADLHREGNLVGDDIARAIDGGRKVRVCGAHQRDVTFSAQKAARGVEPDPASARQKDLGPRVEVNDIPPNTLGRIRDHAFVRELDEVPADEARRETA